jgi:hypothetical protein
VTEHAASVRFAKEMPRSRRIGVGLADFAIDEKRSHSDNYLLVGRAEGVDELGEAKPRKRA